MFISTPAGANVGVRFEIDNVPGSIFLESQIDHAFENSIVFEFQKDRQFPSVQFRSSRSFEHRMFQRCGRGFGGVFYFLSGGS